MTAECVPKYRISQPRVTKVRDAWDQFLCECTITVTNIITGEIASEFTGMASDEVEARKQAADQALDFVMNS